MRWNINMVTETQIIQILLAITLAGVPTVTASSGSTTTTHVPQPCCVRLPFSYWWHCCWLHHDPGSTGRLMLIVFSCSFNTIMPSRIFTGFSQPQVTIEPLKASIQHWQRIQQRVNWWGSEQRASMWMCCGDGGLLWESSGRCSTTGA